MVNAKDDSIRELSACMYKIAGGIAFLQHYDFAGGLDDMYQNFMSYCNEKKIEIEESSLAELKERIHIVLENLSTNALYYINPDKILDEDDLDEFVLDWDKSKTGKKTFKERDVRRFKTITEYFQYEEHNANFLIEKYENSINPLINATISEALMNGGKYQSALNFLANGLNYSVRFPHLYWHTKRSMIGCCHILWSTAWMLSNRKNFDPMSKYDPYFCEIEYKINELLYLTLTRVIDMAPDLPQTCDLLSNRAEMFWPRYEMGMIIFANAGFPTATMEVQYTADKKTAFERACRLSNSLGGVFFEKLNEASMMYRYGQLRPVYTDISPMSINDDYSWDEVKIFAMQRADSVAMHLYERFQKRELSFSREDIETLVIKLRQVYKDVSPREEFFKVYNILRKTIKTSASYGAVPVKALIDALNENRTECGNFECFKHIYSYISSLKLEKVSTYIMKEILSQYKKVERNYNWEKGMTKPLSDNPNIDDYNESNSGEMDDDLPFFDELK